MKKTALMARLISRWDLTTFVFFIPMVDLSGNSAALGGNDISQDKQSTGVVEFEKYLPNQVWLRVVAPSLGLFILLIGGWQLRFKLKNRLIN